MERYEAAGGVEVARFRIGGTVHPIQARKAWEDNSTWTEAVLCSWRGGVATLALCGHDSVETTGSDSAWDDAHEFARGGFSLAEASTDQLPVGGPVWVTERWGVLAFPDEQGNAISLRPMSGMAGTVFARIGAGRLRFLSAKRVEEVVVESTDERAVDPGAPSGGWSTEFVYGVVTGLDDVDRFRIMPRSVAESVAGVIDVVNACSTWGELREESTESEYEDLLTDAGFDVDAPPTPDAPFDPNDVDGLASASNPITPEMAHELFLPAEIRSRFGVWERRMVEGNALTIPLENGPAVVAAMGEMGYRCTEDVPLLRTEVHRMEWMGRVM